MQALPTPQPGGSIKTLRHFLNAQGDNDFVLVIAKALAVMRNRGPSPVLVLSGEQEIDGLAGFIDRAIPVFPAATDFDAHLIHPPAHADRALVSFAEDRLQLRGELLDPTLEVRMIDLDASLCHHLFQVSIT